MDSRQPVIFFITPFFFPFFGVGCFRAIKYCKYLRRNGFQVTVFTSVISKQDTDFSFQDDVAGIKIIRFGQGDHQKMSARLQWVLLLPFQVIREAVKARPKVIIYTGSPFGPFFAARIIKLFIRVPYLLDFRDPWTLIRKSGSRAGSLGNYLRKLAERISLSGASGIVFVNEYNRKMYADAYSDKINRKSHVIENGFDQEDLEKAGENNPIDNGRVNIVYPGKLFTIRDSSQSEVTSRRIENLLRAMRNILDRPTPGKTIVFHHLGKKEEMLSELVKKYGLGDSVMSWGERGYYETLNVIKHSDVGLIIGTGELWISTTKIFDYLAFSKNVLGLVEEESYVAQLIKKHEAGRIVSGLQVDEIEKCLRLFMNDQSSIHPQPEQDWPYYRENQARQLVELIKQVSGGNILR